MRQRLLSLDDPDLGAVLLDPGHLPEWPQVEHRHLDGTGERIQVWRPVAATLDDLPGELGGAALGGVDAHELAFNFQRVQDHHALAGRADFSKAVARRVGGEPDLNHPGWKVTHRP